MRMGETSVAPERITVGENSELHGGVFSLSHSFQVYISERGFPEKIYILFLDTMLNIP